MKKSKNYLLKVKKSRKSYLFIYFLAIIVLFSLFYLNREGYEITSSVLVASLVFIVGIFFVTEVLHRREWWAITETALIHSISILNKNVREVGFSSISDMDLDKPLYKRFLGYGNVNIRIFLNETTIRVKNINSPEKFIKLLQDLISKNRRETNVAKQY
jgi:membrane protein YdbS with pleckstrin-like domain